MSKSNYAMPILIVLLIAGFGTFIYYQKSQPSPLVSLSNQQVLDQCTSDMATKFHIHPHLTIINQGSTVNIPANIGITNGCMSSIHTHDATGVIHIESPVKRDFLLADFFYIWKKPFSKDQVMDLKADGTRQLKFYVNGKEVADPGTIVLQDLQDIVIDYFDTTKGPDTLPTYTWPDGSHTEDQKPQPLA